MNAQLAMPIPLRTVWLFGGVPAALILGFGLVWHVRPASHSYRDLTQDWLSARCFFAGHSIYTPHRESVPRYLGRPLDVNEWNVAVNAHPPASVLALLPLGLLTHDAASLVWNIASLAMLVAAVWIVVGRWGLNCDWWYVVAACCLLACSTPLAAQGATAQFNGLLALLIAIGWASERNSQENVAGCAVGLAVGMKLFPAFLLVFFLATRRWRAIGAAAATVAVLHAVAAVVFGWRDLLYYAQHVVPEIHHWRSAWLNCSLAGFWSRLFDVADVGTREYFHAPRLARLLTYATCGAMTVAVAWSAARARSREERDLAFAATVLAMLLASPVTWDHSLLLLILPVAIIWYYVAVKVDSQLLLAAILFIPTFVPAFHLWRLLLAPTALPVMNRLADPWASVTALAIVMYCLLALLALALFSPLPHSARRQAA